MSLRHLLDLARTAAVGAALLAGSLALCWATGLASIHWRFFSPLEIAR